MDNRIVFFPSETVSFRSITLKQIIQLSITNNWDRSIIFKMKTTRPQLFKMRPVFGLIEKGQEKTIRLIFKGFGPTEKPPCTRDRFTIVVAPAPANCIDPSRVWKQNKCPEVLTQTARKVLRIEYGEVDNSKLVSVRPNFGVKTPEQIAILRKKFPDLREDLLLKLPLSACEPEPPVAKENKPQFPDANNNNKPKKDGKNETEDSSSSSSED
uniref:Major sperm protein n=1 Tax=Panagrolaimus sp. ES5 TaxID=591445 RepID=A0AC34FVQ5_9BILA